MGVLSFFYNGNNKSQMEFVDQKYTIEVCEKDESNVSIDIYCDAETTNIPTRFRYAFQMLVFGSQSKLIFSKDELISAAGWVFDNYWKGNSSNGMKYLSSDPKDWELDSVVSDAIESSDKIDSADIGEDLNDIINDFNAEIDENI